MTCISTLRGWPMKRGTCTKCTGFCLWNTDVQNHWRRCVQGSSRSLLLKCKRGHCEAQNAIVISQSYQECSEELTRIISTFHFIGHRIRERTSPPTKLDNKRDTEVSWSKLPSPLQHLWDHHKFQVQTRLPVCFLTNYQRIVKNVQHTFPEPKETYYKSKCSVLPTDQASMIFCPLYHVR